MATSNNDRISSRRLLDTLKGLQASRHLGSEPEVVTETTIHEAVTYYPAGEYSSGTFLSETIKGTLDEKALPYKVYSQISLNGTDIVVPSVTGEPSTELDVISKITEGDVDYTIISDKEVSSLDELEAGHYIFYFSGAVYTGRDTTNWSDWYVVQSSEYSESNTTKTKHTIKQDYLPNADWNVNDPNADGYVEGRTHWVEVGETEATVNVQSGVEVGNFAIGTCDSFGAVKGFTYPNGEYNPGRVGEVTDISINGETSRISYIGEDVNGNAITATDFNEVNNALTTTNIGIMLIQMGNDTMVYIAYPNVATGDACTVNIIGETVHKLGHKYYDYVSDSHIENLATELDNNVTESIKSWSRVKYGVSGELTAHVVASFSSYSFESHLTELGLVKATPDTKNNYNYLYFEAFNVYLYSNTGRIAVITKALGPRLVMIYMASSNTDLQNAVMVYGGAGPVVGHIHVSSFPSVNNQGYIAIPVYPLTVCVDKTNKIYGTNLTNRNSWYSDNTLYTYVERLETDNYKGTIIPLGDTYYQWYHGYSYWNSIGRFDGETARNIDTVTFFIPLEFSTIPLTLTQKSNNTYYRYSEEITMYKPSNTSNGFFVDISPKYSMTRYNNQTFKPVVKRIYRGSLTSNNQKSAPSDFTDDDQYLYFGFGTSNTDTQALAEYLFYSLFERGNIVVSVLNINGEPINLELKYNLVETPNNTIKRHIRIMYRMVDYDDTNNKNVIPANTDITIECVPSSNYDAPEPASGYIYSRIW